MLDERSRKKFQWLLDEFESQLMILGERARPIYEEENTKTELRAKVALLTELLSQDCPNPDTSKKEYRVELVDFIFATSEHEAIDIFVKVVGDIDVGDDNFDVYEVDRHHNKVHKQVTRKHNL